MDTHTLERKVIGALLLSKDAYFEAGTIKPEYFQNPKLKKIFEIIEVLVKDGKPVDMVTVNHQFKDAVFLSDLLVVNSWDNISHWVLLLAEEHYRVRLEQIAREAVTRSHNEDDIFDAIDTTLKEFFDLATVDSNNKERLASEMMVEFRQRMIDNMGKKVMGIPSGLADLDRITHGWQNTDLIVIGARPGMGKSALSTTLAMNSGTPTAIFSMEMSDDQVLSRLSSFGSEIELEKITRNNLTTDEIEKVSMAKVGHIVIDDTPSLTISDLRVRCKKMVAMYGVKLIIVDYLQLMNGGKRYSGNRLQEIGEISRGLKLIAKELEVPVIALSQLSRSVESRGGDKRPLLSDLRESGDIEQDADMVIFIWRPEYYGMTDYEDGYTELLISKHRNGKLGTVVSTFRGEFTKFVNKTTEFGLNSYLSA